MGAVAPGALAGQFDLWGSGSAGATFWRAGDLDSGGDTGNLAAVHWANFLKTAGNDSNRSVLLVVLDGGGRIRGLFGTRYFRPQRRRSRRSADAWRPQKAAQKYLRADS